MAVDCGVDLSNPVYIAGSSAVKPFLAEIAKILVTESPPVTLVYSGQGSCTGVSAILGGAPVSGPYTYWDEGGRRADVHLLLCPLSRTSEYPTFLLRPA